MGRLFLVVLLLAVSVQRLAAQWVRSSPPEGGQINCMENCGKYFFVGTASGGVFRTSNNGDQWERVNRGLLDSNILSLSTNESKLYVATRNGGAFATTNFGDSWIKMPIPVDEVVYAAIEFGGKTFVYQDRGISYTVDGKHWSSPVLSTSLSLSFQRFAVQSGSLFLNRGTTGSLFLSQDTGKNWTTVSPSSGIYCFTFDNNGRLITGSPSGVYISTNNGGSWQHKTNGLPNNGGVGSVLGIAASPQGIFACTYSQVYRSTDQGENWASVFSDSVYFLSYNQVLGSNGQSVFLGKQRSGVLRSKDGGQTWNSSNGGLAPTGADITCIYSSKKGLLASSSTYGAFQSDDAGRTWNRTDIVWKTHCFFDRAGDVLAGTSQGIYRSVDGLHWIASNTKMGDACSIIEHQGKYFAGTSSGVYVSTDTGATWTLIKNAPAGIIGMDTLGQYIFTASFSSDELHFSSDNGESWFGGGSPSATYPIAFYAGSNNLTFINEDQGAYRSIDSGNSWRYLRICDFKSFCSWRNYLFGGSDGRGILLFSDTSNDYNTTNTGLENDLKITGMSIVGNTMFAGTTSGNIYYRPLSEIIGGASSPSPTVSVYTNPVTANTTIQLTLGDSNNVSIKIYNEIGCEITTLFAGALGAGSHAFTWNSQDVANGHYYCEVRTYQKVTAVPIVVYR